MYIYVCMSIGYVKLIVSFYMPFSRMLSVIPLTNPSTL